MTIDQTIQLGLQHHQAGRLAAAEQQYRLVLQHAPNHPDALHLLGMVARRMGKLDMAADYIHRAIAISPASANYYGNLGLVLMDQHKFEEAISAYQKAIGLNPGFAQAHCNLGSAFSARGQWQQAVEAFRTALRINPNFIEAHSNLAKALAEQKQFDPAVAALKTALQLNPASDDLNFNLGNVLRESGQLDQAITAYTRAIQINPKHVDAHRNMGNVFRDQGRHTDAMACYKKAIAIDPNHAESHWNLSLTQLLLGDFEHGWAEHELRLQCGSLARPREFNEPRWNGQPLAGQTILLHPEQGLGDTLQFVRYAPMVAALGGTVILECPAELHRLLANLPGVSQVIPRGQALPDFDLHCPLMSLPFVLGTLMDSIPAQVPYLFADRSIADAWAVKLDIADHRRRVGLVWAGSATHKNDHNRSLPFSLLSPLSTIQSTRFYSLQKGEAGQQISTTDFGRQLIDHTADLHDFADTAGLITNLDLVITVDTSVAHLAGGMGKPVWLLLPHDPDWRWLLDRDDSPWYPTMRLFRQSRPGDWTSVIERLVKSLAP